MSSPPRHLEDEATLERCGALRDFWYVACLSSELGAKAPLGRTVLGTRIVLFRDPSGAPVAFLDRCLHRNARLSRGDVFDGKLGCPYHGWVYDASGAVVEIPSLGPGQQGSDCGDPAGLRQRPCDAGRLRGFPVREQHGQIYVFLGEDVSRARREPFPVPHHGEPGWCVYFHVTEFDNGVTNLVENFMDVPHTAFVHRGWFRKNVQKQVPADVVREDGTVLIRYHEQDTITGLGRIFAVRGQTMEHTDQFFIPNVTRVDYRWGPVSGFAISSQVTPESALRSRVYTAISYRLPIDLPNALVAKALQPLVRWYTGQVLVQDVDIMQIQSEGLRGAGGGVFTSTEADLPHRYIESYRDWLREGAQGHPPPDESRQITFWT